MIEECGLDLVADKIQFHLTILYFDQHFLLAEQQRVSTWRTSHSMCGEQH